MKESEGAKQQMRKEMLDLGASKAQEMAEGYNEAMGKMFHQGMAPKDALGMNAQVLESIYAQAYRLYNTGKYVEAIHLFRVLILLNTAEAKYTLGLAACFHMMKEYQNAIQAYTMCSVIDLTSPLPYYHISDCFIQMKDSLSAMISLQMALEKAGERAEYAKLKERASLTLESLKAQSGAVTP